MTCFSKWRDFAKWHSLYDLIWKIYNERFYYDYVGNLPRAEHRLESEDKPLPLAPHGDRLNTG